MKELKKSQAEKVLQKKTHAISPEWPVWYFPDAPLGSAVRYIASLSARFQWVGIYLSQGNRLVLGPHLGPYLGPYSGPDLEPPFGKVHQIAVPIVDRNGKILGQLGLSGEFTGALTEEEERSVRQVALELGQWSAKEFIGARFKKSKT